MALPFTLNFFASPSLSVLGASRSLISLSTTQLVLGGFLTLAALPFGLFAVAVSYVGRAYLTLPMQIWLLRRASGIRPFDSLRAVAHPQIGRASWRERVCQFVLISGVAVSLLIKACVTPKLIIKHT